MHGYELWSGQPIPLNRATLLTNTLKSTKSRLFTGLYTNLKDRQEFSTIEAHAPTANCFRNKPMQKRFLQV